MSNFNLLGQSRNSEKLRRLSSGGRFGLSLLCVQRDVVGQRVNNAIILDLLWMSFVPLIVTMIETSEEHFQVYWRCNSSLILLTPIP